MRPDALTFIFALVELRQARLGDVGDVKFTEGGGVGFKKQGSELMPKTSAIHWAHVVDGHKCAGIDPID